MPDDRDGRDDEEAGWAAPHLPPSSPQESSTPPSDPPPPWSTPGPAASLPTPPPATPPPPATGAPPSAAWAAPSPPAPPVAPTAPPATWTPPPAGPARPRRRRKWPWVLGGVLAGIAVLGVVGVVVFVQKIKPPLDAANAYMDDLADRDYEDAFDRLCDELQVDSSPNALESDLENQPELSDIDEFDISPFDVNLSGDEAAVDVDVEPDDFSLSDTVYVLELRKEGGDWKPCGEIAGFRADD